MTDILLCFVLDKQVTENEVILQPKIPQQRSMTDDTITKNYFPSNSDKNKIYSSTTFKEFLTTNSMTEDGLMKIATFYDVKDQWSNATSGQSFTINHYYELLLMVKKSSTKDNIWMSFYEGLHRYAALMMCLICSKIDLVSNKIIHGSLTADYFKTKFTIKEFKEPDKSPLAQLQGIFIDKNIKTPMLTTLVMIKAFVLRLAVEIIKYPQLQQAP
jgi:hypothetical protein